MLRVAYLFERFPSFGQTFCYREVAELLRQGAEVMIFSIRQPIGEPVQDWNEEIVRRVIYLPGERELVTEIERAGELPRPAVDMLTKWGRNPDFLRLYQAAYIGLRIQKAGITRVHAHFAGMAARTAFWIREFFGIEFSLTAHANDIFAPREFVVSLEKLFEAAAAIVSVSDFAVAQLRNGYPQQAAKFHRIYNGLDLSAFPFVRCPGSVPFLFAAGRLIEKKGFGDLISACAELQRRGCDFRCEIAGEGPLHSALSTQIAGLKLQAKVQLIGPLSQRQLAARMEAASLFVLPCRIDADGGMDNLPTVIMEAMASGLPVISTAIAGVPEMVQPGVNGDLVAPGDTVALAEAIARMISDLPRARKLGAEGRKLAEEKFSISANVRSLTAILERR